MTKKILYVLGAIVVVLVLVDTFVVFQPKTVKLGASSNINSINLVPTSQPGGDTYALALNGTTLIDTSGDIITGASTINQFLGTNVLGDVIIAASGFTYNFSTSTTLTAAQFCQTVHLHYSGTSAAATTTFPSATSTWVACGSPAFGAIQPFNYTSNDSTNTVSFVAGTGMVFRCPTTGVGTTTVVGGCTTSQFQLPASSSINAWGYWDASGTMEINLSAMAY